MGNLIRRCCDDPPSKEEGSQNKQKKNPNDKTATVYPLQEMSQQVILMDQNNTSLFKESPNRKKEKRKMASEGSQNHKEGQGNRKRNPAKIAPEFLEDFTKFSSNVSGIDAEGLGVRSPPIIKNDSLGYGKKSPPKEDRSVDFENDSIQDGSHKLDQSFSRASGSFNHINTSMTSDKKKKRKRRLPPMSRKFFGDEFTDSTQPRNHLSCLPTPTPPTNYCQKSFFDD